MTNTTKQEYGWLVEREINGIPHWRTIDRGFITWTTDSVKAIRFCRREDAEMFAFEDEDAERITDHIWTKS